MKKILISLIVFLFLPIFAVNADAADSSDAGIDYEFISTAFENFTLPEAVQTLLEKDIPVPVIINEAKKEGFSDANITAALIYSDLQNETVVISLMGSELSPQKVVATLASEGVDPNTTLEMLIQNDMPPEPVFAVCQYFLNQGDSKAQIIEHLLNAGADRGLIDDAAVQFNIPPATVLAVYQKINGQEARFGHVHNRNALPQPARIAVGVDRVHTSDFSKSRVLSPKNP